MCYRRVSLTGANLGGGKLWPVTKRIHHQKAPVSYPVHATARRDRPSHRIHRAGDDLSGASSVNIMAVSHKGPFTQA